MTSAMKFGLQPAVLIGVLTFWYLNPDSDMTLVISIYAVQLILGVLEYRFPARPDWTVSARDRSINIAGFVLLGALLTFLGFFYETVMVEPLTALRAGWNLDVWPHHWPVLIQLLMIFFLSEFFWYWIHRAEHRWPLVWRASGHGAHHSYKKLGALNSGLNHPFELFLLLIPAATIELLFGVGSAAAGAVILLATQAALVHTNLDMNSAGIGWLLTTNRYHIRHHSVVLEESNTNYGCATIIWDRLFGTFSDGATRETGTGPTEPDLWGKFVMPFTEPVDTATAPGS